MVPFAGQAPRLRRIVRQTSSELGKQVELKLLGMEGELDRTVLERVISPIEHMLRNAIAHGIETPAQRREMGKPETGATWFEPVPHDGARTRQGNWKVYGGTADEDDDWGFGPNGIVARQPAKAGAWIEFDIIIFDISKFFDLCICKQIIFDTLTFR